GDMTWTDQVWYDRAFSMFERITDQEFHDMFDLVGNQARIKANLRDGITWLRGDATNPEFATMLGLHDIVVANRFLCHMKPGAAEACLRNIARLVKKGGYLFVSGVDLDVRSRVAKDLGWHPVQDMIRHVHEGDPSLAQSWPLSYWGIEPFSQDQPDWQ